ncbi:MAG: hypothetical protein LBD31_02835 [Treponema sp.]|jgi:hypothetical protein|nr:hypothetical protein [Treponema sp.]
MKALVLYVPLAVLAFAACATPPSAPAPWAAGPDALGRVYPGGRYLVRDGYGKTRTAAEAAASAELGRFISSEVSSERSVSLTSVETDGTLRESAVTRDEAYVTSTLQLFGIRHADDAYFNRSRGMWHSAAYIDRAEAWKVYEPRFRQEAAAFLAFYGAAENERDPFRKVLRYEAARRYAASGDFASAHTFGQILYPEKMWEAFAEVRSSLAALPQKTDGARRDAPVYIDCPEDFEGRVTAALTGVFAARGFPIAKTRQAARAVCEVTIETGEQKRDLGVFYHPSLRAAISGSSGVVAGFSAEGGREQAVTPDVAKRRAYTALAESAQIRLAAQLDAHN